MDNDQIKKELKSYFQSGDVPTAAQFVRLIDEALNPDVSRLTTGILERDRIPQSMDFDAINAQTVTGDGSGLTQLDAEALSSGTLPVDRLPKQLDLTQHNAEGSADITADKLSGRFIGNGSELTDLNAENVTTGTLDIQRLPKTIDLTQHQGTEPAEIIADAFIGSGNELTNLNADALSEGKVDLDRLPQLLDLTLQNDEGESLVKATKLVGDGMEISNLNPDNFSAKIPSDKLYKGTKSALGVMQFATQEEIDAKSDNRAVTPRNLDKALAESKAYIDGEVALLQAGIKFKKGVATVIDYPYNLLAEEDFPTVDEYTIKEGDRVLFVNQDNETENRVWIATGTNSWTLATDFDAAPDYELFVGLSIEVMHGETLKNSIWTVTELNNPDNPELTWQKRNDINNYEAGTGIQITGRTIAADETWFANSLEGSTVNVSSLTGELDNSNLPKQVDLTLDGSRTETELKADTVKAETATLTDLTLTTATASGAIRANSFEGDGSLIQNLDPAQLSSTIAKEQLPLADIESSLSFVDADGNIKAGSLPLAEINPELPDASESQKGVTYFATVEESIAGELATKAITPATLNQVLNKRLMGVTPKKNILDSSLSVVGYEAAGTIANQFLYSDYATTRSGIHLFISRKNMNGQINVYKWHGSFTLLETINNGGTYTYPRMANWGGDVVLYAGSIAYWFNEQTERFESKGNLTFNGSALATHNHTLYGVCYDGKYRVAVLNSHTDTKLYEVQDPKNPQMVTNPITIPFPTDDSNVFAHTSTLKGFSMDGSEEYGILAYAQSFWQDPILLSRLAPGASSFQTLFNVNRPNAESHSGNALVYKDKTLALHGNNAVSSFGRMDSGTYRNLGSYSGGMNGSELPVFGLNEQFYGALPSSGGSLIYRIEETSATLVETIPDSSTSSQSLGLAIYNGDIYLINGYSRNVYKLLLG